MSLSIQYAFKLPIDKKESFYRKKLIIEKNIYPEERLFAVTKDRTIAEEDFDSIEYGFDDMYLFKLVSANYYAKIDEEKNNNLVRDMGCMLLAESTQNSSLDLERFRSICFPQEEGFYREDDIDFLKKNIKSYGQALIEEIKQEIIERLYVLEVLTVLSPEILIPKLTRVCPLYLGCPYVRFWIESHQGHYKYNSSEQKKKSENFLKRVLVPDRREKSRQEIPYMDVFLMHKSLSKLLRQRSKFIKECNEPGIAMNKSLLLQLHFVSEKSIELIEQGQGSPSDLAVEILVNEGRINSDGSFRSFWAQARKMNKKHSGKTMTIGALSLFDWSRTGKITLPVDIWSTLDPEKPDEGFFPQQD